MSEDIRRLLARYSDGVCHQDGDQWGSTWSTDAVWEMGSAVREGRDAIVAAWAEMMTRLEMVLHNYHQGWADLDEAAGTGTGRWYLTEHIKRPDRATQTMLGFYDDEYGLEDGEWRFTRRRLTTKYYGPSDLSGDWS